MADNLTAEARSALMSKIRNVSALERASRRRAEAEAGCRLIHQPKGLPGRPDYAHKGNKVAVFIHGCFWHRPCPDGCAKPVKSNQGRSPSAEAVYPVPAKFKEEVDCCVEYSMLSSMAAQLKGEVEFRVKNGWAFVKAGEARFRIPSPDPETIPRVLMAECAWTPIGPDALQRAIQGCLIAVAKDDYGSMPLRNIHMVRRTSPSMMFEACDGKELFRVDCMLDADESEHAVMDAMIPQRACPTLIRLCSEMLQDGGDSNVLLGVSADGKIQAYFGSVRVRMSTMAGKFPDCSRLVPETRTHEAAVDKDATLEILGRAQKFTSKGIVKLEWSADAVKISASEQGRGVYNESLALRDPGSGPKEPVAILVSSQQVMGCLKQLKAPHAYFGFEAEMSQVRVRTDKSQTFEAVYVTMPFHGASVPEIEDVDSTWEVAL